MTTFHRIIWNKISKMCKIGSFIGYLLGSFSENFLGCFPIPKLSLAHQTGPHPKPHHPPQNLLGSLHSEERSCKSKKFQGYHQEWIGRDGSLTDKLLLKFSNLNTGFTKMLFDAITLFWKHFPCKRFENVRRIILLSLSYLDLV